MFNGRYTLAAGFLITGVGAAFATFVFLCFFVFVLMPSPKEHRICQASCDLITRETTELQVQAIFGVPPGDYTTRPDVPMVYNFWQGQPHLKWKTWFADRAAVAIGFDEDSRVAGFAAGYIDNPDCSFSYWVRRFFGKVPMTRRFTWDAELQ